MENGSIILGKGWRKEILSISDTVTVPAGTFYDCIKICVVGIKPSESIVSYNWYHKDVGEVMIKRPNGSMVKLHSKNF